MNSIGYDDNFRHNDIYTEIIIDENSKIQFFDVIKKSYNPYLKVHLWNREVIIDSIEEIIAKKIYYRGDVGNARDLFDIAIAIHKEPDIFTRMILSKDKIKILYETVLNINNSEELKNLYLAEIILMNPNSEYQILANNAISYLTLFLENIVASYDIGYELSSEEYVFIENEIWVY